MESLKLIGHFVLHVVLGLVLFVVIGGAAFAVSWVVDQAELHHMHWLIVYVGHVIELLVFGVDTICFVFFLLVEAYVLCKEIAAVAKVKVGGLV
jgi:hypothetical protein